MMLLGRHFGFWLVYIMGTDRVEDFITSPYIKKKCLNNISHYEDQNTLQTAIVTLQLKFKGKNHNIKP